MLRQEISKKNRDFGVSVTPSQAVITNSFPTMEFDLFPISLNVGTFLTASANNTEPFTQKVDYISGFIKTAESRSQVREQLPQASNNLLYWILRPLQFLILKFFNAFFRDQREVNSNIFRALQESLSLNQSLLQEINSLRSQSQRDFQHIGNVFQDLVTNVQHNQSQYVHDFNQRLEQNQQTVHDFNQRLEQNQQTVHDLNQRLEQNQQTVHDLNQRLEQNQQTAHDLNQRLEQTQQTVHDLNQRLEKTQQTVHDLNQRLEQNQQTIHQINQRLEQNQQTIHDFNQRLEQTQQIVHDLNQRLDETNYIIYQVSEVNQGLDKTNTNIYEVSQQVRQDFQTLKKQVEHLDSRQTQESDFLRHDFIHQKRLLTILFEALQKRLPQSLTQSDIQIFEQESTQSSDALYLAFEDQFRGSQEEIYQRLSIYLPYLSSANLRPADDKIVDVGCGRGEWLSLLKKSGYQAIGVDLNKMAIVCCQQNQLNAVHGDAIEYLKNLPDKSLGGLTGFHIIEHLPFDVLLQLLTESYRIVRPGGIVIFETPNPSNVLVGSCNFYFDPTHRNPIPSLTAKFLMEYTGFSPVTILPLNPSTATPFVEESDLAQRLNQYFYGPMDYAVIAQKSMN